MQKKTEHKTAGFIAKNRRQRIRKKIVRVLACIVVFCTTYALILPALTLEKAPSYKTTALTAESGAQISDLRAMEPNVLNEKFFALYNPSSNSAISYWSDFGVFMKMSLSADIPISFSQKTNGFYTAITDDETTKTSFITTYRQWTFVKSEDGSGSYIKIGSVGQTPKYLQIVDGAFQVTDSPSVFTVLEGTGNFAGQFILKCGDYAVSCKSNYLPTLDAVPIADAVSDASCYFYMVNRAINSVELVQGITPSGTVINMFDYWITEPDAIDQSIRVDDVGADHRDQREKGINQGHTLKFLSEGRPTYEEWNDATPSSNTGIDVVGTVYQGLVRPLLDADGYPVLNTGKTDTRGNKIETAESLSYLFDPSINTPFRSVHRNVGGLLQMDNAGYHYYNSRENYAYLCEPNGENSANKQITLYSKGAVEKGQFFPFTYYDTASEQDTDGGVQPLNHYFGLTLTSNFYQMQNGMNGQTPITFDFSGDDDVWIFIDDVLVADLGGIHGRSSVNIDFSTGNVTIDVGPDTTIREAFQNAGKDTTGFNNNTLPDDTYHTLKFFYMERGASQSNLSLKYNLVTFPTSGITKVDQIGDPVPGAEFELYHANANYETDALVCSGTTGDDGEFVFLAEDGQPLSLQQLYKKYYQSPYFVLKETKVPEGYRSTGDDIHLKIHTTLPAGKLPVEDKKNIPYVMVCDNTRQSGAWAAPILQAVAPNEFTPVGRTEKVTFYDPTTGTTNGQLFGVVLKYVGGERTSTSSWMPVYGSAKDGYTVVDPKNYGGDFLAAVLEAASHYGGSNYFKIASSGRLEATLNELPGNIDTYNFLAGNDTSQYIVAYYYTDTDNKTSRVRDYTDTGVITFTRNFGTSIQVPNLINRIAVQKLSDDGVTPLNGAVFAMYEVEDTDASMISGGGHHEDQAYFYVGKGSSGETVHLYLEADLTEAYKGKAKSCFDTDWSGTYELNSQTGVASVTLGTSSQKQGSYTITPVELKTAVSASDPDNHYLEDGIAEFNLIPTGKYIVRELTAPIGYRVNPCHSMVMVTKNAIYANAGTATDGISVSRGPGYLASNLNYYATHGDISNTLTWIYSKLKISSESNKFVDVSPTEYQSWTAITQKHDGTSITNEDLVAFLVYEHSQKDSSDPTTARFSYAADDKTMDPNISSNIASERRLYTEIGWSYLEIYQNYGYGNSHHSPYAEYEDWRYVPGQEAAKVPDDLSNLFSRSVYIHVTDPKQPADLEIAKTVKLAPNVPAGTVLPDQQEFTFTVTLTQDGTPITDTFSYQIYNIDQDGNRTLDGDVRQLDIQNGSGTIILKHSQAAVIKNIPADAQYTVTENLPNRKYSAEVTQKILKDNKAATETLSADTVSSTMYWLVSDGVLDNLSKVDFVNTYDPNGDKITVTVRKVDGANQSKYLSDAEFVLTRADGKYYSNDGWIDTETKLTTNGDGEIIFSGIEDGRYTLTEKKAPDGYHMLKDSVLITVENGKLSATIGGRPVNISADAPTLLTVPNSSGYVLPETGGEGIKIYIASGLVLMALAGAGLIYKTKKRRSTAK